MAAVSQEIVRADAGGKEKGHWRLIALGGVAPGAREHEVVATVERGLSLSRRHVVERHYRRREANPAVGAHGTVLLEQPDARFEVGGAAGRMRGERRGSGARPGAFPAAR